MHLTLRPGSAVDSRQPRQNTQKEKVPEDRRLLLAA
jgi:hypothetical protein